LLIYTVVCLSVCLEKVNILECLCAEPLKKTMVITADDGSAYAIGEYITNVKGKKVSW